MAGDGEQMRMWGGWKGLPLPASHWPGMTTFSLEASSSSSALPLLLRPPCSPFSSPSLPSSICAHLPLLLSSSHPHHNRNLSLLALAGKGLLFSGVLYLFFPPSPPILASANGCRLEPSPLRRFFFSPLLLLLHPFLLCLSLHRFHVGWLHISPARCFSLLCRALHWSRPC